MGGKSIKKVETKREIRCEIWNGREQIWNRRQQQSENRKRQNKQQNQIW